MLEHARHSVIGLVAVTVILNVLGCSGNTGDGSNRIPPTAAVPVMALGANNPTPTAFAEQATTQPEPTATFMRTPVPEFVGARPQSFDMRDHSVIVGDIRFQAATATRVDRIGDQTPAAGQQYLLIDGYIYNYGDAVITLHDIDFDLIYMNGSETVSRLPDTGLLSKLREEARPDLVYPDRNLPLYPDYNVSGRMIRPLSLIYDVPLSIDLIHLAFLQDEPNLSLLLLFDDTAAEYRLYKTGSGVEDSISLDFDDAVVQGSEALSEQDVMVDNCFGTTDLARAFEFASQASARLEFDTQPGEALDPLRLDVLRERVTAAIRERHQITDADLAPTDYTRSEVLTAAPGTKPRWQFVWLQAISSSHVDLRLGDDVFRVPYTVYDEVSYDLRSIPTEGCPG